MIKNAVMFANLAVITFKFINISFAYIPSIGIGRFSAVPYTNFIFSSLLARALTR